MARSTIADILKRHGSEPASERKKKTTWKEFLAQHWELLVAADFFTVEVWTQKGLQRFMVLFFIELSTRKVEIAGIASVANRPLDDRIARNVTDAVDGILQGKRYLIHDRDPLYTAEFLTMLQGVGVESVKLPPRSPNLNAYAERFVTSIKESCLERMMLFGEESCEPPFGISLRIIIASAIIKGWRIGSSSPRPVILETLARSRDASA
jgi:hypothetical protein